MSQSSSDAGAKSTRVRQNVSNVKMLPIEITMIIIAVVVICALSIFWVGNTGKLAFEFHWQLIVGAV